MTPKSHMSADETIREIHAQLNKKHDVSWTELAVLTAKKYAESLRAQYDRELRHGDDMTTKIQDQPANVATLDAWVMNQENKPDERPNPKQRIEHAVNIAEKVAYARGLRDGLDRLERISLLIPNRTLTGPVLIKMAQNEIRYAIKKWQDENT
jgi:hypothetical protein